MVSEAVEIQRLLQNFLSPEFTSKMMETGKSLMNPATGQPSEKFVSKIINRFMQVHQEMSKARFDFIVTQNSLIELKERDAQLEDLGEDFKVLDYENLKTEVQAISSNIDMKQGELETLRKRFDGEQKKSEILKEKRMEKLHMIQEQKIRCENLQAEESLMRDKVQEMKMQQNHLQDEHNEMMLKAGILNRAHLLNDYNAVSDGNKRLAKEITDAEVFIKNASVEIEILKNTIEVTQVNKLV